MEIRKPNKASQPLDPRQRTVGGQASSASETVSETQSDVLRPQKQVQGQPRLAHLDRIELSGSAARHVVDDMQVESLRKDMILELRDAYRAGTLHTPERATQAAANILTVRR